MLTGLIFAGVLIGNSKYLTKLWKVHLSMHWRG